MLRPVREVVLAAMCEADEDAWLGKPCRCGGDHTPRSGCYVPADVLAVMETVSEDELWP